MYMFKCALHQVLCLCYYILYPNPPINLPVGGNLSARELKDACNRIKINTEGQLRAGVLTRWCLHFFMQKYTVYWPEGRAANQYSVFIGQKMSLTGRSNSGQHAQCDMHEDTSFKSSNVSCPSVCLYSVVLVLTTAPQKLNIWCSGVQQSVGILFSHEKFEES